MKKTFLLSCLLMVLGLTSAFAQIQDPVQFKYEWKVLSDTEAQIVFTGAIDEGWHVYSTNLPDGGPISATFNVEQIEGLFRQSIRHETPLFRRKGRFRTETEDYSR